MQPIGKVKEHPINTFNEKEKALLKTSLIYGGNASGKSNLIRAMKALEYLVSTSNEFKIDDNIDPYEPFILDRSNEQLPVELEINFVAKNGMRYNYCIAFSRNEILKETLIFYPNSQPAKLFLRIKGQKVQVGENLKTDISSLVDKLYSNQLLLSKTASEKIDSLIPVYTFFDRHFFVYNFNAAFAERDIIRNYTKAIHTNKVKHLKANIDQLLHFADVGITNITVQDHPLEDFKFPNDLDEKVKQRFIEQNRLQVNSHHPVFEKGKIVADLPFDIGEESTGTQKLLALGGIFIDGLGDGDVIIIDELDNSLHPLLTKALINLFHSDRINRKNAQLIFASHDVSLLSDKIFRRDQIYFAEKDYQGASKYYSLADIKGVRKGISYEKYYMKGAFGGTPILNEFFIDFNLSKDEQIQETKKD